MAWHRPFFLLRFFYKKCIWNIPNSDEVFLTFDDGPDPQITPWVINFLEQENIKATFFCVGNNIKKEPEIFKLLKEKGHSIGHHSMNHENGFKTKFKAYVNSVSESKKISNSSLFRPPYGKIKPRQLKEVTRENKVIMWSWLSYDFSKKVPIRSILNNANKTIKKGDILVFHDNVKSEKRLKQILPQIVKLIKKKEIKFGVL